MSDPNDLDQGMQRIAFLCFCVAVLLSFSITVSIGMFIGWVVWGS